MTIIRTIFEDISKAAIQKLGLSTSEQRVDSTHITSNICIRGRLDLFRKTIELFLKSLGEKDFSRIPTDIQEWHQRESNGWFGMGQADDGVEDNKIKIKKNTAGETLQSPYDLDASFGHKGNGHSAHITETCNNEGKSEIAAKNISSYSEFKQYIASPPLLSSSHSC